MSANSITRNTKRDACPFRPFSVGASEQEAKAYLDYCEYFLGEWSVAEEDGDTGTWTVAMSPTGCSVTTLLKLGDVTSHGEYGYDPTTSTWLGVGFLKQRCTLERGVKETRFRKAPTR